MINLIINEINKVKKSRLLFSQILFLLSIYIMFKVSKSDLFDLTFNLIPFIGIMSAIFFGGSISGEIENGSLRFYLTKPYKRWKIYLSKLLTIYFYILFCILLIVIFTSILKNSFNKAYYFKYIIYCIPLIFMGSFILYLSVKLKSQSLTVGISIVTICFSLIISQILFGIYFNIIEYTFLPYLDFSLFNDKNILSNMNKELGIHLSLKRGIIIDILSTIIFYTLGTIRFNKKDIKN